MARGSRYVEVQADALLGMLREIGAAVKTKGGSYREGQQGREIVAYITPPHGRAFVRIYTSLAVNAALVRDCGEDAIRINVATGTESGDRQLTEPQRVFRTAPAGAPAARQAAFLERLRERLRGAYAAALSVPACAACGRAMAIREGRNGKFYGCVGYPACRQTRAL